ncbi:hypothetical protein P171DRAFT_446501 [Karstenula rhodostoma CBS 690.94]|uniref:Uncharacterized protein n=1 Tax=Karstenula rhodostoma CBS 690.94 TaxID=1392251 RepID=A0A9P4PAX2_9PLEO|nr:hypothetical protein P171DRAFT_446501 [Karstenula rhodostoma CBS 690.94]
MDDHGAMVCLAVCRVGRGFCGSSCSCTASAWLQRGPPTAPKNRPRKKKGAETGQQRDWPSGRVECSWRRHLNAAVAVAHSRTVCLALAVSVRREPGSARRSRRHTATTAPLRHSARSTRFFLSFGASRQRPSARAVRPLQLATCKALATPTPAPHLAHTNAPPTPSLLDARQPSLARPRSLLTCAVQLAPPRASLLSSLCPLLVPPLAPGR